MQKRPVYYPQEPVSPKYFAGRREILLSFDRIMESAAQGRAENAAIYGARGIGKTSLLFKIKDQMRSSCFTVYYSASHELRSKEFVDDILQKMQLQYKTELSRYRKFLEGVKALPSKIEELSLFDISMSLRREEKTPQIALMEGVVKFRERGFNSLYIFIDEADLLADEVLAMIRNTLQELRSPPYSFAIGIVAAGKEDLIKRLTGKLSPIARFFSTNRFELLPLSLQETRDALALPARELHIEWENNSVEFVYTASKGFPFIVQLYGKYALEQSNDKKIDLEDAKRAHAEVIREVGMWYDSGWNEEPSSSELEVLLAIADLGGSVGYSEVRSKMNREVGTFLRRLVSKGCLFQDKERNRYYFPHSLVSDYLKIKYSRRSEGASHSS